MLFSKTIVATSAKLLETIDNLDCGDRNKVVSVTVIESEQQAEQFVRQCSDYDHAFCLFHYIVAFTGEQVVVQTYEH